MTAVLHRVQALEGRVWQSHDLCVLVLYQRCLRLNIELTFLNREIGDFMRRDERCVGGVSFKIEGDAELAPGLISVVVPHFSGS